ncbi:MAG TPA: DCC1-like thiol-disulfide oxidoreductase family protein [Planctomycetota bacterium]|nr:DCC1-like thiol-disulfide oxidoreductase family protein [Planctomycetota bacterium]
MGPLPSFLSPEDRVVGFDGQCNMCSFWAKVVHRNEPTGKMKLCPLQSDAGKAMQAWAGVSTDTMDTMIFVDRGRAYTKSGAALRVAKYLRWPFPLLWALLIVPWFIRDWIYNRIAKNRYTLFGKEEACMVPTAELRKRFVA